MMRFAQTPSLTANSATANPKRRSGSYLATGLLSSTAFFALTAAHAESYEIDDISVYNTVNVEDYINTLPQFVPDFDASSNNPGNGAAQLNLRGLGAERTLILIDGRRFAPSGVENIFDVNNIPMALIERVDIITGRAAAVYGPDAVAGVVNFILKDDFEGIELDMSHELSAVGWDANTTNIALTIGGVFAEDRGSASVTASYTNRESLLQGERAFSASPLGDLGAGATSFGAVGSPNIPGGGFFSFGFNNFGLDSGTNTNFFGQTIADIDPLCGAASTTCSGFRVNGMGGVNGFRMAVPAGQTTDEYNYAPTNYLQIPQERYNISGFASFEINDHIEAYMRGVFSNTIVTNQLAPTPAFLNLTINLDNPAIPATLLGLISGATSNNGNGTASLFISKRYEEVGLRRSTRDTTAFQLVAGLRGDLNETWSYDTYFNFSRSKLSRIFAGNISRSAVQASLLCDGGPTAIASGCTAPTLNLFGGPGSISPAAAAFIERTGAISTEVEQTQWVGTLSGNLNSIHTPWTDVGATIAVGAEYRELFANRLPDSVLGPDVNGFNASTTSRGRYDVYEAFGEVIIPIVSDVPFVDSFSINGAYRYSDYSISNVGGVHTFSVGGDWSVIPELRFRAQFQRATRAPNIAELFSQQTQFFPAVQDPCFSGAFGPSVIVSTCIATGVPAAIVGTPNFGLFQVQVLLGGNPNLSQEVADTLTIGMVWRPELVDGLTLNIDYYDIDISSAITTIPLQVLLNECHLQGVQESCDLLIGARDPATGRLGQNGFFPMLGAVNIGRVEVRGIDFDISYGMDAFGGALNARYSGSYTLNSSSQLSNSSPATDCAGMFAGACGEPRPTYKHTAQFSFQKGLVTASVRWRALSGVNSAVASISNLSNSIGFTNYLDVETQYAIGDNLDLTLGVRNITGKDAPLVGTNSNAQLGAAEQANTWPATYEHLGRQVFFGASLRF